MMVINQILTNVTVIDLEMLQAGAAQVEMLQTHPHVQKSVATVERWEMNSEMMGINQTPINETVTEQEMF